MVIKLTILNILEPFLSNPKEALHLSQLSKELKEPHPTLRQHFNYLEKLGIVKKEIKGRLTLYSLNFNNPNLIQYLFIAEKFKLIKSLESNLLLKELAFYLNNYDYKNKYLVFGSFVDDYKNANDLDLIVVGEIEENKLNDFSKKYDIKVHPIQVNSMEKISNSLKNEILKRHLIINSTEEFLRWLYG